MAYKLLGMIVWKGAKIAIARKLGRGPSKAVPLVAGGVLVGGVALAVAVVVSRRGGEPAAG